MGLSEIAYCSTTFYEGKEKLVRRISVTLEICLFNYIIVIAAENGSFLPLPIANLRVVLKGF